jgi:hypothetical protein
MTSEPISGILEANGERERRQTMDGLRTSSTMRKLGDQDRKKERRILKMKSLRVLSFVELAVLLLAACGGGSAEPAAQAAKDYSHEVDMEALTARRYTALQEAKAAKAAEDYGAEIDMEVLRSRRYTAQQAALAAKAASAEVDMEVLLARRYTALQLVKATENAADNGENIDMEVLTSRRYQAQQAAEAIRIAQVNGQ